MPAVACEHGKAVAAQTLRRHQAVYNYHGQVNSDLPKSPREAAALPAVKSRDRTLSDDELRARREAVRKLGPLKRVPWLTLSPTGPPRNGIRLLRWEEVNWENKVIRLSTAKLGRIYSIPMADRPAHLLS